MSSSLTIKNLNPHKGESSPISYEFMPQPPFRLIVCGASHSGKSNMIKNMITIKEYGYSSYFGENIYFRIFKDVGNKERERTLTRRVRYHGGLGGRLWRDVRSNTFIYRKVDFFFKSLYETHLTTLRNPLNYITAPLECAS